MKYIDYRKTSWGHSHSLRFKDGVYEGACWHRYRPEFGDVILLKTNYGHAEATITEVRPYMDPHDMYYIKAKLTRRVADESIVSQEELDESFKQ